MRVLPLFFYWATAKGKKKIPFPPFQAFLGAITVLE